MSKPATSSDPGPEAFARLIELVARASWSGPDRAEFLSTFYECARHLPSYIPLGMLWTSLALAKTGRPPTAEERVKLANLFTATDAQFWEQCLAQLKAGGLSTLDDVEPLISEIAVQFELGLGEDEQSTDAPAN